MQPIYNIAEICSQMGIKDALLSPGSRCAPITVSFARHKLIKTRVISDERAAAFTAVGIARQSKRPVVLVCTSGSAALNYAPAVAEAFYQQIPLLILTADRPPEYIDQLDGQTIRQAEVYGKHVKGSFNLPVDFRHDDAKWQIERSISEAINLSKSFPQGPVHINIPLREPFYPQGEIVFEQSVKVIEEIEIEPEISETQKLSFNTTLAGASKILIVAGQCEYSEDLCDAVKGFCERTGAVLVADIISNCWKDTNAVTYHDLILANADANSKIALQPDIVISFGLSVISKALKQFLRNLKPRQQWHIQQAGYVADTFHSLTSIVRVKPFSFFSSLAYDFTVSNYRYQKNWLEKQQQAAFHATRFFETLRPFSELEAVKILADYIPDNSVLHLSNSMPVRYANYIGLAGKNVEVCANRGTSGIDGVISTAYGAALATSKIVTVLTGDMAFFYDRNAFWNNYMPGNLRVIILNNHGGGIFRMIEGPARQPELEEYFETRQSLTAVGLAHEYDLQYFFCKDASSVRNYLRNFFSDSGGSRILEIETDPIKNTAIFNQFKEY